VSTLPRQGSLLREMKMKWNEIKMKLKWN
jgi:hypothetical protein